MRPANVIFFKLFDETQMSNPPEPAMHHYTIKLSILLPPETFTLDHSQMRHPVGHEPGGEYVSRLTQKTYIGSI